MYKALEVTKDGQLELVEKQIPTPLKDQVLIQVEACGMCGADLSDIFGENQVKRVPGHEVIGRIVSLGEEVSKFWTLGQRVGVGRLAGHCNECIQCRQGAFVHCTNQSPPVTLSGATCELLSRLNYNKFRCLSGIAEIISSADPSKNPLKAVNLAPF